MTELADKIEAVQREYQAAINSVADAERADFEPWGLERKLDALLFAHRQTAIAINQLAQLTAEALRAKGGTDAKD